MAKVNLYISLCALISFKLIWTAELQTSSNDRKRTVSDPVSNFFSQLGDAFLDIDASFAIQTAPKVEYQDGLMSGLLGPLQPRKEYFERIQDNYKTLQNRLGSAIADAISQRQIGADPKIDPLKSNLLPDGKSDTTDEMPNISAGNLHFRQSFEKPQNRRPILNAEEQMRTYMERILADARRTGEFLGSLETLKPLRDTSSVLTRRSGDISKSGENSDPQGRIIGDNLYSESRFDQYLRQLLRNHGRWVLDNPLLKSWRSTRASSRNKAEESSAEQLPEAEEVVTTTTAGTTTEAGSTQTVESMEIYENEFPKPRGSFERRSEPLPLSVNYYEIADNGEIMDGVDIVLQPQPNLEITDEMESEAGKVVEEFPEEAAEQETEHEIEQETDEELEAQDTVILAFTPDGVPLKLRMGPEIENPVMFLHGVLRAAGVTLKVPVESYEDLEPVGKEVLLLGMGSGIITRAVYLDLSNPNELKSLLRTLIKSKVSEREKY